VLTVRYLLNHPEAWPLLLILLLFGARPDLCRRLTGNGFWVIPLLFGIAVFAIYGLVNIEERYVTVGYLSVMLTLFASLRAPGSSERRGEVLSVSSALIFLLALLAVGESTRRVADMRRILYVSKVAYGWYKPEVFQAAKAINDLGIGPGDTIACAGTNACLYDIYWAHLAGVRILSEIYLPAPFPYASLADTPNLPAAIDAARRNGARILVGYFDPVVMKGNDPTTAGWVSLGDTAYYMLPLNPPKASSQTGSAVLP
jgi:hypothetical protein